MKISPATNDGAPIVLLYGSEGRGKSTLAFKFPKPLAILLERGLPKGLTVDAVDDCNSYDAVIATLGELIKDSHGYETLVLDTLDAFEPLLIGHVCAKNGWRNIEQPSYGKGYVLADDVWRHFIRGITTLRDRQRMTIVLVAHSVIDRVDDPRSASYTSYSVKLHKRARHLVLDACDVVGFLGEELNTIVDDRERVRATSSNRRFLFCEGQPAFMAKNRYGIPPKVPVPIDFNIGELTKYWNGE
jgi:hypothetical protein